MSDLDTIEHLEPFVQKALEVLALSPATTDIVAGSEWRDYDDEHYSDMYFVTRFIGSHREEDLDAIPAVRWLEREAESRLNTINFNVDSDERGRESVDLTINRDRVTLQITLMDESYTRFVSWHAERPGEVRKSVMTVARNAEELTANQKLELANEPEKLAALLDLSDMLQTVPLDSASAINTTSDQGSTPIRVAKVP
jgi:hypothetical protein